MADLEKRVSLLEKALVEQGKVIAALKKEREVMQDHINELSGAVDTNIKQLWENQQVHEIQLLSILNILDPENYPLPEELREEANAQPNGEASPEGTGSPVH